MTSQNYVCTTSTRTIYDSDVMCDNRGGDNIDAGGSDDNLGDDAYRGGDGGDFHDFDRNFYYVVLFK